ncbi:hypothetical protein DFH09DRAFT_1499695 [Mycena vulgaris]|nr:hypothetical protein DFH09DRAFT_1499695 [Mycena vulgaris]
MSPAATKPVAIPKETFDEMEKRLGELTKKLECEQNDDLRKQTTNEMNRLLRQYNGVEPTFLKRSMAWLRRHALPKVATTAKKKLERLLADYETQWAEAAASLAVVPAASSAALPVSSEGRMRVPEGIGVSIQITSLATATLKYNLHDLYFRLDSLASAPKGEVLDYMTTGVDQTPFKIVSPDHQVATGATQPPYNEQSKPIAEALAQLERGPLAPVVAALKDPLQKPESDVPPPLRDAAINAATQQLLQHSEVQESHLGSPWSNQDDKMNVPHNSYPQMNSPPSAPFRTVYCSLSDNKHNPNSTRM